MIVSELIKKASKRFSCDLRVVQEGEHSVKILAGAIVWKGVEYSTTDVVCELAHSSKRQWVEIYLARQRSDGACVVIMDQGVKGEIACDLSQSIDYEPMYLLCDIDIPEGVGGLSNATIRLRRLVGEGEEE